MSAMRAPRESTAKPEKSKLEADLDRSRKEKFWIHSNYGASIAIIAIFVLAFLNMCADVRGEFAGNCDSMGGRMVICSIIHADKQIQASLMIPDTPMMICTTSDENIGNDVDWDFKPARPDTGAKPLHFRGKIDANALTGVILLDDLRIYRVTLNKDPLASIARQLRAFIPGAL